MDSFVAPPGLYVHVPFCHSFCPFCPYNKTIFQETLAESYFAALTDEAGQYLDHINSPFTSLYIGGGTPTLCLDQLAHLLKRIPVTGERAIEVLPSHATPENVALMRNSGINYISLGVQSFSDEILHHLGRPHTAADNKRAFDQTLGQFECVDVDLIFDVSYDKQDIFIEDALTCFDAGVDQLSTYPLMRFGYTPFGKARHYPRREHEVLRRLQGLAEARGYERRSVWTFNRIDAPNYTSITREFYLGIGAGAASYTGTQFLVNHFGLQPYVRKLQEEQLPVARQARLGRLKSALYYIFWQCYTGSIGLDRFAECFPAARGLRALIDILAWSGHLHIEDGRAYLTAQGYDRYHDLERWITYHFIEPLWEDMMQEHEPKAGAPWTPGIRGRFWRRLADVRPVDVTR
jgi:oxygen-independent coproporphyrinogen-3 oxidase